MLDLTSEVWIVTDVDGTLMDHHYDLSPALPTLSLLKKNSIPVILCTSKTSAEVRLIRKEIDNIDPFIIENGGAIYGNHKNTNEEWEIVLGSSYKQLRKIFDSLSAEIGYSLIALNDLSNGEINKLTGLNNSQIDLALQRHWSVPFLNPPEKYHQKLNTLLDKYKINIFQGNRMSHLLGRGSHKGKAVTHLKKFLKAKNVKVIGLGDSPNDLPLLQIADISVIVPGSSGPNKALVSGMNNKDYIVAPYEGAKGWSYVLEDLIKFI
ncbi:mannosyl-3-phosphoglycerate phosphatase-related protein YedP [Prochlorococcus sp. MIT 1223]|uniref:mannosyl-3-phosphoglycerate phosphatase-related protein YedP n=1 Tax=Prochlorococcus sp. MIT 1223 TaxID=3096217 RepID=UPI002A754341|nr:mannosyl-3-phosphoglycerate phosphatase-related protein YedP [Prochlorococcus sp. MIT 1223]